MSAYVTQPALRQALPFFALTLTSSVQKGIADVKLHIKMPLEQRQVIFVPYSDLNVVQIDLTAIAHNMAQLKGCLRKPATGLMPVVKSDGYGHGMCEVAKVAVRNSATALAVFDVNEAVLLRQAGFSVPILLISGILPEDADIAVAHGLTVGVTDVNILNILEAACKDLDKTARIHLKVDTGMSRMGLSEIELSYVLQHINLWHHLEFEGIYSHIACADCAEHALNKTQLRRFGKKEKGQAYLFWNLIWCRKL